jgi:plasmid stability protein
VWWPLLVAALVLLLLEVAVRRVNLPETWQARWQRWRAQRHERDESEPDYETLRAGIAQERARHQAAVRADVPIDPEDPASRARLYLASRRRAR